ncbi:hypothetical protein Acr_00g0005750 [Actinidia rufa]|uniref:Uncharacterized protein n=1 Tax=Actinidia rufa TaxID=165716 RepID=A0A7J0D9J2_9ERIC|nr:hypothetical protein Acr_00g0005750 [Actinidia rufa]
MCSHVAVTAQRHHTTTRRQGQEDPLATPLPCRTPPLAFPHRRHLHSEHGAHRAQVRRGRLAQAWAFRSQLFILNTGRIELKSWKVGFQYEEILVGASRAMPVDVEDFPARVGKKGTTLAGYPMADLKTAIATAGNYNQIPATGGPDGDVVWYEEGDAYAQDRKAG